MKTKLLSYFIILLLFYSFCNTQSFADNETVLRYNCEALYQEFDPFHATSVSTFTWQSATMIGLYSRTSEGYDFVPALALGDPELTIVSDEMTVIVDLNSDNFFSNGDPVTAEDIAFTYQLLLSKKVNHQGSAWSQFNPFTYDYLTQFFSSNDSIVALDSSTISFTFSEVSAMYKRIISAPIINKADYEYYYTNNFLDFNFEDGSLANGAGPFQVEKINWTAHEITLIKNDYWEGEKPNVDKIVFTDINIEEAVQYFNTTQVHIVEGITSTDVSSLPVTTVTLNDPTSFFIGFNHDNPYINGAMTPLGIANPEEAENAGISVRKAISSAMPREELINDYYEDIATVSTSIFPEINPEWESSLPDRVYSLDAAKLFMEEAGFDYSQDVDLTQEVNENNTLFTLYLLSLNSGGAGWHFLQALYLEEELPKIGINVVHETLLWDFYDLTYFSPDRPSIGAISEEGQLTGWDLVSCSFLFDFDYDVENILDSNSLRPEGNNFFNYENAEWDNLVEEYSSLSVLSDRKEKADDLKLFLNENEPIIPVYTILDNYVIHNAVSGYDEVLLSISALEWEKLVLDLPDLDDGKAGIGFVSLLLGVILLPVVRKKRAESTRNVLNV